jgi:hypothetical protein
LHGSLPESIPMDFRPIFRKGKKERQNSKFNFYLLEEETGIGACL